MECVRMRSCARRNQDVPGASQWPVTTSMGPQTHPSFCRCKCSVGTAVKSDKKGPNGRTHWTRQGLGRCSIERILSSAFSVLLCLAGLPTLPS
ncbi:hypothetical protein M441DRAFT_350803 [Trichoderma asperellum CBS 433.97]|uniref:Uncharacterized protein n=1 Tax=Trichoderma asperellum (strain ATCC 204424 / CBS 433.97 / NBRC 101777) TaxID=1042311 RepID=A0A2T3ZI99_TRIA4|nr:hypothetical protein M441DRAFT_350803 [Trichoderma asperellum CBS 433.97]PTB44539.1 hypothetical protein M441DRAFT_350803 [Trichoderma asperellum CBS 433.97]